MLHELKQYVVPAGRRPRRVPFGIASDSVLNLNLGNQMQHYLGLYEHEVFATLRRFSPNLKTAIDVGAADGMYALYFMRRTGAEQIFAFEPGHEEQSLLWANMDLNYGRCSRFRVINKLVGSGESGTTTTLDSLLPFKTPCLIKIDVDGAEMDVLRGAERVAGLPNVRWIIETHSAALERECIAWLRERSYTVGVIENAWWRRMLREQRPLEHNRWLSAH